ncbi:MAG: FG-GAP-like repeat-containing protein [Gemmatimonadaceae bacterium]
MIRRLVATMGAVVVAGALGCADRPPEEWQQEAGYRWRELAVGGREAGFTRLSAGKTGIDFTNTVSESLLVGNRNLGQGAGIAIGDVDGDGLPDVFMARTEGCNALYRNLGGWRFEDIAKTAGVQACDRFSSGTALADIDGDDDLDLILLATTGPNAIFVNDGKARFTEHRDLGLDSTGNGGTTLALADVDGDGTLDMYVANYKAYSIADSLPPQQSSFAQMVRETSPGKYEVVPERRRDYRIVMRPDMGGLRLTTRGAPDDFYLNRGGTFARIPWSDRMFIDRSGKQMTEEAESFGLAAKFVDLNGDRAPELYVANDFEDTDELWLNNGKGAFRLSDWSARRQMSNSAMGVDVADVNGDGLPDIFEVDMLSKDTRRAKTQIPTHSPLPKKPGDMEHELQQQRNVLFLNRGDYTYAEVSMAAGVQASGWSWATAFMDVDLDGWQDILITTGHLWDLMDADIHEDLANRLKSVHWQRLRWEFPPLRLRNVAFRNRGDQTFEDASASWRFGVEEDISHALAAGDLDGDGDLDVVVGRLGSPALVMRNDASAPRVAVRLIGVAPNTRAVGASIRLEGGAIPIQVREVVVGGLFMSHSDYQASFAMGTSDSATIVVNWRDGRRTIINGVRPNREYEITTATSVPVVPPDTARAPVALFEDVTRQLGGHTHVEDEFDDWDRQLLLPNALSALGPGISWLDIDGDGDEDLVVGTGKGGRISLFRNDRGRLVPQAAQGPIAQNDVTTILSLPASEGLRLLVGVSTWQARSLSEMTGPAAVVSLRVTAGNLAPAAESLVGSTESATGPLAQADYDGDGDLDLFIGGRAIAMRYPVAASSGFFRNNEGKFELDQANTATVKTIGMVSAATFADVNGDGHPDLVLAREWNSILLLLNDGRGRLSVAPESWGLARHSSRWNGIATGDLDGDGRLDLVATSWGRNTMMQADSAHPLVMVHGPFGAAGEEEMLMARFDPRIRGLSAMNSYARVRTVMPSLVQRIPTFFAYADATVEQILGKTGAPISRLEVTTLDHTVFFNRASRFDAVPMPREAQLAPASYAGITDFDGDGFEDIFLSQNFFPTEIGTPRYDTGRSLLLTGSGGGGLTPLSGARSGLLVYGDQRGAAYSDFDHDGRVDLVVSQNGGLTRLFRNRGATPGLRVRLQGSPSNPNGIGTQLRIVYGARMGPVREVQAGSGYWSQNGAVQVLGLSAIPTEVWARWPGGVVSRVPVPAGAKEVVVRKGDGE